jgi:L-threonylcarbamoyladenylate synthase
MTQNINQDIEKAVQVLKDGGIIIFPTDTAFGIGCRLDKPDAVDRLFHLRKRPLSQATPVLVSSIDMATDYYKDPTETVLQLAKTFWPGALTIIWHCRTELIHPPVRGNGDTIGLRMPNHPTTLSIIASTGIPLLGPSANFHGSSTPYRLEDIDNNLIRLVDYVVPGECSVGNVSTVVDCTKSPYVIVRQGAIVLPNSSL